MSKADTSVGQPAAPSSLSQATDASPLLRAWLDAVLSLVKVLRQVLTKCQPPNKLPKQGMLREAMDTCELAARQVGSEHARQTLSRTLRHVHLDAISLAKQVCERDGDYSSGEWIDASMATDALERRFNYRIILEEFADATLVPTQSRDEAQAPHRVGRTIIVRGQELELTDQLARLLELALKSNGSAFDEVRRELDLIEESESGIGSRVAKLNNLLKRETRQTTFTISVTARGKRVKALILQKPAATEKVLD